jgi:hypothetical protein
LRKEKLRKKTKKWWENHNYEDACVCLCDISYSHFIVQHKQKMCISLSYMLCSFPSPFCSSFPFIKNATNRNFYCNGTNRRMGVLYKV